MNINTEFLDTHEAKLTVVVDPENFQGAKRKAAKQLSKKYKIPGFRPGKAPFAVIQKHVGEGAITEQAIGNLIDEIYPKAIEEANLSPYGPGSLEEMSSLEPPTFEFLVPLIPEVKLSDYKDVRIEFTTKEVTEENIQEVIDNLRENQATIEPVERPIEEGDMVYITLSGDKKGEEDPDKKVLLEERRYPVIIEKEETENNSEYPFPGFSRKLIGLNVGDKKKVQNKFKEDYEFEELRGVTGIYQLKVEEIKGRTLPEVNDEFAKSVGDYETLEDLHNEIKQTLTEQFKSEQQSEYDSKIIDFLIENAEIKYPPQMLEDEIDDYIHDLEHQLANQGLTIDLYLKSRSMEMSDLRDEVKENAEARMKRGLILMEVANTEEIEISPEEINERVQQTLQEVTSYYSEEEANRLSSGANLESLKNRIATDEIISRTLQNLRNIAMGKADEELEETTETPEADSGTSSSAISDAQAPDAEDASREEPRSDEGESVEVVPDAEKTEEEEIEE
ncbi:MAG: trigger factor [Aliifodinibius sp.]|nr:trigger factor [Fodinibius sp.]